ncbi:MAG: heme-binding domain-containing protein [Planctomycetota bacterium]
MRISGKKIGIVLLALFVVAQLVPYGRSHDNPPVGDEPPWDSPQTRALAVSTCFDCHSNETEWPWYSHVAPISWLVQHDVDEGREHLNFSEFNKPQRHAHDAAAELEEGEMPLWFYKPLHADAQLSDADKEKLVRGLRATMRAWEGSGPHRPGE